jgi:surface antigen
VSALAGKSGLAAVLGVGLASGGCSFQLGSLYDKHKRDESEVTGALNPVANAMAAMQPDQTGLPESDLAFTRIAASDVLAKDQKNVSQSWENPQTGARGSVTALTSAFIDNGNTCREFLASHVQGKVETWLEGSACQNGAKWEVRSLKAWKRT